MLPILRLNDIILCSIIKRINRFVVRVNINNVEILAYLANTGRLSDYLVNGKIGFCIPIKASKLRYRIIAIEDQGYAALIDTKLHETAFIESVKRNFIPWLSNCFIYGRNINVNDSIIDFSLLCNDSKVFIELKSAVLRIQNTYASYPDCPSKRGRKQLESLSKIARYVKSYVVFVAALPNIKGFKPSCDIDPYLCSAMKTACRNNVIFKSINIFFDPKSNNIVLADSDLPIDFNCN
uniref:DNA/RNA nuclease SfsA n=1 Tax=Ignisphaera aggregans TaxID=334771 RepID=A0A7C5TJ97_9CREN